MADVAVNGNGNGQAVAAVAFGAHPDDDEIAEIDDAVIGADTHADYNRTEEYFAEKKPSVMFPAAHGEYGGRVNVERMTALDFKRFLMSDHRPRPRPRVPVHPDTKWYHLVSELIELIEN